MANILKRERQKQVLHMLCEGSTIRATERISGVHWDTIRRLLVRAGTACKSFLDDEMRGLTLRHVQTDEMWTFVGKKQGRFTTEEKAERSNIGDVYLWTCIDEDTKLVPCFALGKRSADNARRFMVDLAGRLIRPVPHASDTHAWLRGEYRTIVQISTDGFAGYPEAVDLAFGPYVKYGQLVKNYRNTDQPGRYAPPEMAGSDRRPIFGMDESDIGTICTSHIERHNLTVRVFLKWFTRLSLGFSKKLDNLAAAVALFIGYYNYCWRPRLPGATSRRRVTPAMAVGKASEPWTFAQLFERIG
jgi:IS1 family transposase